MSIHLAFMLNRQRGIRTVAVFTLILLLTQPINAKVVYVSGLNGNDASTGLSWQLAKKTVISGLIAATYGDEIWVAAGHYSQRITLKHGVALYGGFSGTETSRNQRDWLANQTILDGNQQGSVVTSPPGITSAARIDGFTIQNGYALEGGGIACYYSSPTITNNTIIGNNASSMGGGIYCIGSPAITNNTITGNSAQNNGGGVYLFSSQSAVTNNTISVNAAMNGAGIFCENSNVAIINNTFTRNSAYNSSGIYSVNSNTIITNNSIINSNSITGGAVQCYADSSYPRVIVANNIVAFNSAGIIKGSNVVEIRNNCVYSNTEYNYYPYTTSPGVGDISVNPQLVDLEGGDYHLRPGSPCINTGYNAAVQAGWNDMDGQPRIINGLVDIGADEYLPPDSTPPDTSIISGPTSGSISSTLSATFGFTGSDDRTATPELLFQHRLNGGEWSAASSATSASLTNLPQGLQTSEVRAIDLAGNIDPTPAAASWTVDTIPPSTPTVTDGGAYTLSQNTLTVSWTSTDGGSGIAGYQYAVGTSPTDPGSGYILGWTNAGVNTSASISGLGLNLGQTYYIYVKATDAAGLMSLSGASDGIIVAPQVNVSPGGAKLLANGTTVALQGVIVTASSAQMNGRLYVTDTGRSSGIAVSSNSAAAVGDVVSVAGTMSATTDGERIIVNPQVSLTGATVPVAGMEMILRSLASRPFFFNSVTGAGQRGVTDPSGISTNATGQLVMVSGYVNDIDGSFIFINDGSFIGSAGIRIEKKNIVKPVNQNDWVTVTGIVSMRRAGSAYQPVLKPRTDEDVSVGQ